MNHKQLMWGEVVYWFTASFIVFSPPTSVFFYFGKPFLKCEKVRLAFRAYLSFFSGLYFQPRENSFSCSLKNEIASHSVQPVAKFIVPYRGDQVDYGIGLPYRPASLCSLTGRYIKQPYAIVNILPPIWDSEFGIGTLQYRYSKFPKWFFVSSSLTNNRSLTPIVQYSTLLKYLYIHR